MGVLIRKLETNCIAKGLSRKYNSDGETPKLTLTRKAESCMSDLQEAIEPRFPTSLADGEVTGENLRRKKRVCGRAWNYDDLQKSDVSISQQGGSQGKRLRTWESRRRNGYNAVSDVRNGQHLEGETQKRSEQISVRVCRQRRDGGAWASRVTEGLHQPSELQNHS